MSRFFSSKFSSLVPYTPGEQPKKQKFIKLNTNESPFAPCEAAVKAAEKAAESLQLYSDPECAALTEAVAQYYGLEKDEVLLTNGSDEILNFAFMAFCDKEHPAVFPDITYGFYKVFALLHGVPYEEIPLHEDMSVCVEEYIGVNKTVFIANPNAPTGILLSIDQIEQIVSSNRNSIVVIDEAYVEFGGESCIPLVHKYDNLLVTRTFSKSCSMAGARLGFGVGNRELIRDLNTIKYSTNPYNINSMTMAAGLAVMQNYEYTVKNCAEIVRIREYTASALEKLGFSMPRSSANFLFVKSDRISGAELYSALREKSVLVRHFETPRLKEYNRVTIGSMEQMEIFIEKVKEILEERQ